VASGALSVGHARALLALRAKPISDKRRATLSHAICRCADRIAVKSSGTLRAGRGRARPAKPVDVHTRAAEERLRLALGTRVRIVRQGSRGKIRKSTSYRKTELIRIYDQLTARV